MPPVENLPSSRFLPSRWRRIGKMGVAARTVAETVVETLVTTSGGTGTALARTSRTPASADPEMELLRDPGGMRKVTVPTLAPIPLVATTDVAATGVGNKKIKTALQIPHSHPDHLRRNNLLLPLSQSDSISRFLQYIIRPQANPRPKTPPRSCQRFRPASAREKTSIVNLTRPWTPRA